MRCQWLRRSKRTGRRCRARAGAEKSVALSATAQGDQGVSHWSKRSFATPADPSTRLKSAPTWLLPEFVIAASPQGPATSRPHRQHPPSASSAHDEDATCSGRACWIATRPLVAPSARPAAVVHQTERRAFGGHMARRRHGRRELARRRDSGPRCRVPPTHAAGTGPLGVSGSISTSAPTRSPNPLRHRPRLCRRAGDSARQTTPLAAHSRTPAGPRRGRRLAPAGRRDPRRRDDPARDAPLVRAMIAAADRTPAIRSLTTRSATNFVCSCWPATTPRRRL